MGLVPAVFHYTPSPFVIQRQALVRITSDTSKVTLGRKVLVPGVGLEPTTLGTLVRYSSNGARRATGHGPCPSCI